MNERDRGDGSEVGRLFRALKGRPTPEVDAEAAWQRLEKTLGESEDEPATFPFATRLPAMRGLAGLAVAAGLVLAVALGVWVAAGGLAGDRQTAGVVADGSEVTPRSSGPAADAAGSVAADATGPVAADTADPAAVAEERSRTDTGVVETGAESPDSVTEADVLWAGVTPQEHEPVAEGEAKDAVAADAGAPTLELRLARGYRGAPSDALLAEAVGEPADRGGIEGVPDPAAGAGGASPVLDIADRLAGVLEQDGYVLLGRWQGSPAAAGDGIDLGRYEIRLDLTARDPAASGSEMRGEAEAERLQIRDVALVDASGRRLPIAAELTLEPGRLYLLGVRETADRDPDLVLALRLRAGEPDRDEG